MRKPLLAAALTLSGIALLARTSILSALFTRDYLPHRFCYLQQPWLVWTNVTMDGLIAISYAVIFATLFWIAGQMRSLQDVRGYIWILVAFGIFIVACGTTHLMELVTVWWPVYPFAAGVKVVCAAASLPTAILFTRAAPALSANIRRFLDMLSTTQQEKEQAMRALVASEKLAVAGRISALISHEITNPLETANNVLHLLSTDRRIPSDLLELLGAASAELKRAEEIAHTNLSLLRSTHAAQPLAVEELVENVVGLQQKHLAARHIVVEKKLRAPRPMKAYSGELRQILTNLIQNAAAAIGSNGRILIRVQPRRLRGTSDQPGYAITVADTGLGIAPEHRAQLFTLLFTTKGEQGTGLGLWLVRSMVEKQGGRIRVRSRTASESPKHGTIFSIWVPLEPTEIGPSSSSEALRPLATI